MNYIEEILISYGIQKAQFKRAKKGYSGENYEVYSRKKLFLKIKKTKKETKKEIQSITFFLEHNIKTPKIILTTDQKKFDRKGDYYFFALEHIEGQEPLRNVKNMKKIALLLNKIHSIKLECPSNTKYPWGIIHGDLYLDNMIEDKKGTLFALDFEDAKEGYLIYDIAMTINGVCFVRNRLDTQLLEQFLKEYNKRRTLTSKEKKDLYKFLILTNKKNIEWHLNRFKTHKTKVNSKRAQLFENRNRFISKMDVDQVCSQL